MLFFYIRHGEPIYNPDSLTPQGHRQAEALAKRLALFGIQRVYASSSERAKMTAQPLCDLLCLEPVILDWCNESHAGKDFFSGDLHMWYFQHPEWKKKFLSPDVLALGRRWYDHPDFAGTAFREGTLRIDRESDAFFASLGYEHDREKGYYLPVAPQEERVALFAHQGFGESFLSSLLDIPYPLFSTHFDFGHSSMSVIEFQVDGGVVIPRALQVANDAHLYREGLPLHYHNRLRF